MKPGDPISLTIGKTHVTAVITAVEPSPGAQRIRARHGHPPLTEDQVTTTVARLKGTTAQPPAPLNLTFQVPGSNRRIRVGHQIKVRPSSPGKQDGYLAVVREAHTDADGKVTSVSVTPAKRQRGGKVLKGANAGFRTFSVSRLQPVNQPKAEVE